MNWEGWLTAMDGLPITDQLVAYTLNCRSFGQLTAQIIELNTRLNLADLTPDEQQIFEEATNLIRDVAKQLPKEQP